MIDKATASMYTPARCRRELLPAGDGYIQGQRERQGHQDRGSGFGQHGAGGAEPEQRLPNSLTRSLNMDGDQSDAATRKVAENTAAGEAIGDPVVATDGDDDILTYTLVAAPSPRIRGGRQ